MCWQLLPALLCRVLQRMALQLPLLRPPPRLALQYPLSEEGLRGGAGICGPCRQPAGRVVSNGESWQAVLAPGPRWLPGERI